MGKKVLSLLLIILLTLTLMTACSQGKKEDLPIENKPEDIEAEIEEENIPSLRISYSFSSHNAPLILAAAKEGGFNEEGIYLKQISPKEKYLLISGEEKLAYIDLLAVNGGEEVMDSLVQGEADLGFSSIEFPLSKIDEGYGIKILGPVSRDGISLVMDQDLPMEGIDDFVQYIREEEEYIRIGYHSASTIPVILFEAVMNEKAITLTRDVEDREADILLVDLKGSANLIPSLLTEQVDGWIGASPFPELAELEDAGKVVFDIGAIDPIGKWREFPGHVALASNTAIEDFQYEMGELFKILTLASRYVDENQEEVANLLADWTGMSKEAAINSKISYSTEISENWVNNVDVVFSYLQNSGIIEGQFEGKEMKNIMDDIFYFSFALKAQ